MLEVEVDLGEENVVLGEVEVDLGEESCLDVDSRGRFC